MEGTFATTEDYIKNDRILVGHGDADLDTDMNVLFSVRANKTKCSKEKCLEMLQTLYDKLRENVDDMYEGKFTQ